MTITHTFNVHFWLKKTAIRKDRTIPIYARIWINSLYADISTKEAVLEQHWCTKATRVKKRKEKAKFLNDNLDLIVSQIKKAYKELKNEERPITAQAIKARYLGKDRAVTTVKELLKYHKEHELKKLAPGTRGNYGATEKYVERFIKKQYKSKDIPLVQVGYTFIVNFEDYLRTCPPLREGQPLNNIIPPKTWTGKGFSVLIEGVN